MVIASDECGCVLFSSTEEAKEAGYVDDEIIDVPEEYVQSNNTVYAFHVTIVTFMDEDIDFLDVTHSEKESVQKMFDFMKEENVAKFIKTYVDSLPEDEQSIFYDENGEIPIHEFVSGIVLDNLTIYMSE